MYAQESQQARHRATGGRGYGREAGGPTGPADYTPPRREGGRHRAPDTPSTEFAAVPMQQRGSLDSPPSGFRRAPGVPTTGPGSGAIPAQGGAPDGGAGPRRTPDAGRSPHPSGPLPAAPSVDEPVTIPVRRTDLDRTRRREEDREAAVPRQRRATDAAPSGPSPALRPLAVRERAPAVRPGAFGTGTYGSTGVGPARTRTPAAARQPLPWERSVETRLGLVGSIVGAVGVLLGLAPWSGLLPRVMPTDSLGSTPLFSLVGALCGVAALGIGAFAMFRADGVGRSLFLGVGSACLGAAAVVVGLTL